MAYRTTARLAAVAPPRMRPRSTVATWPSFRTTCTALKNSSVLLMSFRKRRAVSPETGLWPIPSTKATTASPTNKTTSWSMWVVAKGSSRWNTRPSQATRRAVRAISTRVGAKTIRTGRTANGRSAARETNKTTPSSGARSTARQARRATRQMAATIGWAARRLAPAATPAATASPNSRAASSQGCSR